MPVELPIRRQEDHATSEVSGCRQSAEGLDRTQTTRELGSGNRSTFDLRSLNLPGQFGRADFRKLCVGQLAGDLGGFEPGDLCSGHLAGNISCRDGGHIGSPVPAIELAVPQECRRCLGRRKARSRVDGDRLDTRCKTGGVDNPLNIRGGDRVLRPGRRVGDRRPRPLVPRRVDRTHRVPAPRVIAEVRHQIVVGLRRIGRRGRGAGRLGARVFAYLVVREVLLATGVPAQPDRPQPGGQDQARHGGRRHCVAGDGVARARSPGALVADPVDGAAADRIADTREDRRPSIPRARGLEEHWIATGLGDLQLGIGHAGGVGRPGCHQLAGRRGQAHGRGPSRRSRVEVARCHPDVRRGEGGPERPLDGPIALREKADACLIGGGWQHARRDHGFAGLGVCHQTAGGIGLAGAPQLPAHPGDPVECPPAPAQPGSRPPGAAVRARQRDAFGGEVLWHRRRRVRPCNRRQGRWDDKPGLPVVVGGVDLDHRGGYAEGLGVLPDLLDLEELRLIPHFRPGDRDRVQRFECLGLGRQREAVAPEPALFFDVGPHHALNL